MYLISQLSLLCGVPVHTIRYYEKYGLIKGLKKDTRTNNYRYYDEEALEKLELIEESKTLGLSLSEIEVLLKAWFNSRVSHENRISALKFQLELLDKKTERLEDVKSRLGILIGEMEKFS